MCKPCAAIGESRQLYWRELSVPRSRSLPSTLPTSQCAWRPSTSAGSVIRYAAPPQGGSPPISSNAAKSISHSRQRSRPHINLGFSLTASPARLRVSQGRTALRSVAHSAMRPHRGAAPGIPVCPPREHVSPRPLRLIALWSVLRGKTIPPLHPSHASGRSVCLLGSGKPTVKTHTHECGSISSGWPPNQPASRIAKLFGEDGACGLGRSRA